MNVYNDNHAEGYTTTASHHSSAVSGREHRKSHSLTGFGSFRWAQSKKSAEDDALILTTIGSKATSQKGVWSGSEYGPEEVFDHPLFTTGSSSARPPKMPPTTGAFSRSRRSSRHRQSTSLGSTDLNTSNHSTRSSPSPLGALACFGQQNHTEDVPPPPMDAAWESRGDEHHLDTLGACRVDSMVLSRENSPAVGNRLHRKTSSLGPEDMLLLSGGKDDGMQQKSPTTTVNALPMTPSQSPASTAPNRHRSMTSSPQISRKSFTGSLRKRASSLASPLKLGKLSSAIKTPTGSPTNSPKSSESPKKTSSESPKKTSPLGSPRLLKSFKSSNKGSPTSGGKGRTSGYAPLGSEKPPKSPNQRRKKSMIPMASSTSPKSQRAVPESPLSPPPPPPPQSQPADAFAMELPLLAKPSPTSFLTDATSMALRSTEQDPAKFQMSFPSKNELLLDARLCQLLESSRQQKFEAWSSTLCGMSRLAMQEFAFSGKATPETVGLSKEIVQEVLNCGDMLTVVAYIAESLPGLTDKREILICESQKRHQLIVVYRGTNEEQLAVKKGKASNGAALSSSSSSSSTKDVTSNVLHSDQPVAVQPWLKDAYFGLEGRMAATLDRLTDENPFCDIVFTGSAFGGGLAQLAAFRLASMRPTMRIACNVFGAPIVGQTEFRRVANTLPNLKVMRVEYGSEVTSTPSTDSWTHIGHSLVLRPGSGTNPPSVLAYRFEKNKPGPSMTSSMRFSVRSKHQLAGADAYVALLDSFPKDAPWLRAYVGEDVGKGVRGSNNEKRNMV